MANMNEELLDYSHTQEPHLRAKRAHAAPYRKNSKGLFVMEVVFEPSKYQVILDTTSTKSWIRGNGIICENSDAGKNPFNTQLKSIQLIGTSFERVLQFLGYYILHYELGIINGIVGKNPFEFDLDGAIGIGPTPPNGTSFWTKFAAQSPYRPVLHISFPKSNVDGEVKFISIHTLRKTKWSILQIDPGGCWTIRVDRLSIGEYPLCEESCYLLFDFATVYSYAPRSALGILAQAWNAHFEEKTGNLFLNCDSLNLQPSLKIQFGTVGKTWDTAAHTVKTKGVCVSGLRVHDEHYWALGAHHLPLLTLVLNGYDNEVWIQ